MTVLLTPITTCIELGENPGLLGFAAALARMLTAEVPGLVWLVLLRDVIEMPEVVVSDDVNVVDEDVEELDTELEVDFGRTTRMPIMPAAACETTWQWNRKTPG